MPAVAVVMAGGVEFKLVDVNVKGPPAAPNVIFSTATVAAVAVLKVFVKVHEICAAANTLAAGMVSTLPARLPKLPGLPVTAELASVQVALDAVKLVATVSVTVTAVL